MNENDTEQPPGNKTLYKDDYLMIREHSNDDRVAVYVGHPPEDARPTIAEASELIDALQGYVDQ